MILNYLALSLKKLCELFILQIFQLFHIAFYMKPTTYVIKIIKSG